MKREQYHVTNSTKLKGWESLNLSLILKQKFPCPIIKILYKGVSITPSAAPSILSSVAPFQGYVPGASNGHLVSVYIVYHVEAHGPTVSWHIYFANLNDNQCTIQFFYQQNQKAKVWKGCEILWSKVYQIKNASKHHVALSKN